MRRPTRRRNATTRELVYKPEPNRWPLIFGLAALGAWLLLPKGK